MENIPLDPNLEALLQDYHYYCCSVSGLASATCRLRLLRARSFLVELSAPGPEVLSQLSAAVVVDYLAGAIAHTPEASLPSLLSGVRCFLRFLHVQGLVSGALEHVLPAVARPTAAPLPQYLSPEQLEKLLGAMDRESPLGRRDYALVLGLARLGLRAGEIAGLRLEEVDWDQGTVSVRQSKSRQARLLPLPQTVGQAWVLYLRRGRPPTALRQVFVSDHQPPRAMTSNSVSKVVSRALARAGLWLPSRGAHVLRHTMATHLVQRGASLKAVADLLGHRQLQTTRLYAKVNRSMLAAVAQPWPEVQP